MSWTKAPRPATQYTGANPSSPRAPAERVIDGKARMTLRLPELKTADRKSQAIRDSARGMECTVRIIGACTHDPATTIWSHAPLHSAGKGGALKSIDLCGAYACTACDAVIDGQRQRPPGASATSVLIDWFEGHMRSLVILRQKGLV